MITGANGHLGSVTVKKFLEAGYRVVAIDQGRNHLDFASGNPNFSLQALDLSDEGAAQQFVVEAIAKYGRIDGALLLVGGFAMGDIASTDGAALRKMISLNVETAYFLARPLFAHMLQNGYGRLVFMGARPALKPEQGKSAVAYALSKNMLFELASLFNATAKGKNVVASVVAPSTIDTEINRKSMPDANPADWVRAEQIADVLEFICSEKAGTLREPVYKVYNNA